MKEEILKTKENTSVKEQNIQAVFSNIKNKENLKIEINTLKLKISKTLEDYNKIRTRLDLEIDYQDLPSLYFVKDKLISLEKEFNNTYFEEKNVKLENGEEFKVQILDSADTNHKDAEIAVKYLFGNEKPSFSSKEKDSNFYLENYTDFEKVKKHLLEKGLEVLGGRERLSQGVSGIIFRLKVKEINTNKEKYIVEKIGIAGNLISSRFKISDMPPDETEEPGNFFRYKIFDEKNNKEYFVMDTTYTQSKALTDLQGLHGIPEYYGAVFDGAKGSIFEEFIDGEDMQMFFFDDSKSNPLERLEILKKFKKAYEESANRGYVYVYSDPFSATNMLSGEKKDPYLTDWYLYDYGDMSKDQELNRKFKYGLEKINHMIKEEEEKNNTSAN
ncbi:hypothetical protein K8Q94_02905 [Candidatus Nomurabacteria bacterium]|nr:hypothetical protein [Candidatus Nomurabacteria bacterium]